MKKILITRTDRLGDVVLSTPVLRAVREAYPDSFIAVMVRPYTKECIEGNPYINEVILYDKYGIHKSLSGSFKFALELRKRKFDIALVLHPTNRVNLIVFLAGIPRRVGFNKKLGFLLTKRLSNTKHLGKKHEADYTMDIIRAAGIEPKHRSLYIPTKKYVQKSINETLLKKGVLKTDRLVVLHPSASCPSKKWPYKKFAALADRLIDEFNVKIALIGGADGRADADKTRQNMKHDVIDLSGRIGISQLASLLKRCHLFISNDSGPVHVSSAVGTPVISIFGRRDPGLGPVRWGPTGKYDIILHKDVGCSRCLAHNCDKNFLCLSAIEEDEVFNAAKNFLDRGGCYDEGHAMQRQERNNRLA